MFEEILKLFSVHKNANLWGTWMAKLVKLLTPSFGSDLMGRGIKPHNRSAIRGESAWGFSPAALLHLPRICVLSLK